MGTTTENYLAISKIISTLQGDRRVDSCLLLKTVAITANSAFGFKNTPHIMKYHSSHSPLRRGFTLVELLVVITIIAVLAGLGFAGFNLAIESVKKASARGAIASLIQASDDYFEKYSQLPLGSETTNDEEQRTENDLMAALLGLDSAEDENTLKLSFFEFKSAKGKNNGAHDGLERSQNRAELLGPWLNKQKSDRHYRVLYDYDYDEELDEPQNLGNQTFYDRRSLIYHMGKDGKVGNKNNKDNVYSWNRSD